MTPHLARNDESPQDLRNSQGTTATTIASASAIAAATTDTMVGKVGDADCVEDECAEEDYGDGEVGDADCVDDECAKEDHGDGKVGDANPVNDESAEEYHMILSNSYNWIIKGVEELDEEQIHHMNAFYALLKKWF
jgi:uncharacterized low-complexity protein